MKHMPAVNFHAEAPKMGETPLIKAFCSFEPTLTSCMSRWSGCSWFWLLLAGVGICRGSEPLEFSSTPFCVLLCPLVTWDLQVLHGNGYGIVYQQFVFFPKPLLIAHLEHNLNVQSLRNRQRVLKLVWSHPDCKYCPVVLEGLWVVSASLDLNLLLLKGKSCLYLHLSWTVWLGL